jgi:hypothetical protein
MNELEEMAARRKRAHSQLLATKSKVYEAKGADCRRHLCGEGLRILHAVAH